LGIAGLGRAFTLMLPTFRADARLRLVGAADSAPAPRARFVADFAAPAYDTVEALAADPEVEAIYVATPHQHHARHVVIAAAAGKHVLVEKPMALTLGECDAMIEAADRARIRMVVGHSHSFDAPISRTRALIESGRYGAVRMITALNYTDFLYRPRRPEELDTAQGGGIVHSQASHQIDILRVLGGGMVRTVLARTGVWDKGRPTEGAYQAQLTFDNGAMASAVYSGYGRYDSDALMGGIGEMGQPKDPADYGSARRRLRGAATSTEEAAIKAARNYGGAQYIEPAIPGAPRAHQHFGFIVVSCDKADLRPTPTGIEIFENDARSFEALAPPTVPRREVIDELVGALREGKPPLHDGAWARATTEVCLGILASAGSGAPETMHLQVAPARAP
jgi:phthalate 4,5-cis-dihydrodiol dehydrogenase